MIPPTRIRGRPPTPRVRAVDHIVVDQRCAVQQLHDRSQPNRSRTPPPSRRIAKQQQRRTQPLPSAAKQITRNLGNRLEGASALSREFFLNQNQILSHEIKNLFGSKQRDSLPPLACNHLWDSAAADTDGWER
jgi:hypothetical protein